jgi:hypothetical protein
VQVAGQAAALGGGGQAAYLAGVGVQPRGHLVELLGQFGDLVVAVHRQALAQIAGRDGRAGAGDGAQSQFDDARGHEAESAAGQRRHTHQQRRAGREPIQRHGHLDGHNGEHGDDDVRRRQPPLDARVHRARAEWGLITHAISLRG